jgi:NAD(P)-dependent dehydrogenase (short-subunit alcohol dehydrogenase family)
MILLHGTRISLGTDLEKKAMCSTSVFRPILRLISPVNKLRLTCERQKEDSVGTLKEAVVVVTGASRGLGKSIAEELAGGGAKVVVNYSRSKEPAEELVDQISESGGEAIAVQADVSDAQQAQKLIDQALERFNRVDVLINNAGINIDRTLRKLSVDDWDKVIQVDLNSAFYTVHAVLPHMTDQGGGKIINMSSFVGEAGNIGQANYSAAKAGLLGFTKTAAQELARFGITVNAIAPGFIETDMVANIPEEAKQKLRKQVPLGRFGKPEEVAKAVRYLIEDGDYITGQSIDINGGIYIRT